MKFSIYVIEDHRNKLYVGMTSKTPEERFRKHVNEAKRGVDTHLYRAMRKYGIENFVIVALDTAQTKSEAYTMETEWIENLGTYQNWGYNETPGGEGAPGGEDHPMYGKNFEHTREAKERMRNTQRAPTSPNSKLSQTEAGEIKYLSRKTGKTQQKIGEMYGISQRSVSKIQLGQTYSGVKPRKP